MWDMQRMCVHKNTLSLLVCTSKGKTALFKAINIFRKDI
jgi:hypothetical protein